MYAALTHNGRMTMAEAGATTEGTVVDKTAGSTESTEAQQTTDTQAVETHEADSDTEPGGNSPQEIRARKEYRLRKRLEAELFDVQQQHALTNARLKTLEEVTKPAATKPVVYTRAQLQAAVDAGTITLVDAADYLAEQRAKETADRVLKQERARDDENYRLSQAQAKIDEYVAVAPWLKDKYDARRKPLEAEYNRLIDPHGIYRDPDTIVTELRLLEKTFGSVESFKAKMKLDRSAGSNTNFHSESGAGGGLPSKPAGTVDASKLPPHVTSYLEKSGMNQKDRESYIKTYLEKRTK